LAIEEPSSADVGSQPPEQSGADEISSVPLTPDDLSLAPADPVPLASHGDESIYGLETDPVDSQLDLARAYIDMGNQEGAYPVLTQVMEEGSLSQQAEARALLNRLDVS
jgi:pilus assembly protein FimV